MTGCYVGCKGRVDGYLITSFVLAVQLSWFAWLHEGVRVLGRAPTTAYASAPALVQPERHHKAMFTEWVESIHWPTRGAVDNSRGGRCYRVLWVFRCARGCRRANFEYGHTLNPLASVAYYAEISRGSVTPFSIVLGPSGKAVWSYAQVKFINRSREETSQHQSARVDVKENKKSLKNVIFDSQESCQDMPQCLKNTNIEHSKNLGLDAMQCKDIAACAYS